MRFFEKCTIVCTSCVLLVSLIPAIVIAESTDACRHFHRVGVISMVAGRFDQSHVGITVFNNHIESNDISSWHVDDAYEIQLGALLSRIYSCTVIPIPESRSRLDKIAHDHDSFMYSEPDWKSMASSLRELASASNVDALLIVAGKDNSNYIEGRTIPESGRHGVGAHTWKRGAMIYLNAILLLIDGETGQVVKSSVVRIGEGTRSIFKIDTPILPRRNIAGYFSRTPFREFDEESLRICRQSLIDLPESAWIYTLPDIFDSRQALSK
jgi:hypothetical protein